MAVAIAITRLTTTRRNFHPPLTLLQTQRQPTLATTRKKRKKMNNCSGALSAIAIAQLT
jgi:hypothetical protein